MNAYKHGLRAEKHALPAEDREELEQLTDEWLDYYRPESPGRRALLDRAVLATLQLRRNARFQAEELSKQVRSADERFVREQDEQVEALKARLDEDPAAAVRELRRSAAGCRWLIGAWSDLKSHLDEDGCWYADTHRDRALRLLGKRPEDKIDEDVYWLKLINLAAWPGASQQTLAWYLEPRNAPDTLHRLLARGCPSPEHGTSELREIVTEELAVLEAREAYLRDTIEEPDRAGAGDRALILEGEAGARWLRYERMHDSSFHRAYKALLKREEGSEPEQSTSPPDEAVTAGASAPNEANPNLSGMRAPDEARPAAPNEAGSEGQAAPNEAKLVVRQLSTGGPGETCVSSSEPVAVSAVATRVGDDQWHPECSQSGGESPPGDAVPPDEAKPAGPPAPNEANPVKPAETTRANPHECARGQQLWDGPGLTTDPPSGRATVVMDLEFLERIYGPRRVGPGGSPTGAAPPLEALGPVVPP